jgi:hypothetical protein
MTGLSYVLYFSLQMQGVSSVYSITSFQSPKEFRGGVISRAIRTTAEENRQAILGRIPFDSARFQRGNWLGCRGFLRDQNRAGHADFELTMKRFYFSSSYALISTLGPCASAPGMVRA